MDFCHRRPRTTRCDERRLHRPPLGVALRISLNARRRCIDIRQYVVSDAAGKGTQVRLLHAVGRARASAPAAAAAAVEADRPAARIRTSVTRRRQPLGEPRLGALPSRRPRPLDGYRTAVPPPPSASPVGGRPPRLPLRGDALRSTAQLVGYTP